MDDFSRYMNRNLKDTIVKLEVIQGTAKDSGNVYYALEFTLINGYTKRLFLQNAEQFAFINAFQQLDTQKQIDNNF